jgi:hypothetical protein
MERRPGPEYDFNGESLETVLGGLARSDPHSPVILATLFLAPGRHAGPLGDIADICRRVEARTGGFRAYPSPLVGTHPDLIEILAQRLRETADTGDGDAGTPARRAPSAAVDEGSD